MLLGMGSQTSNSRRSPGSARPVGTNRRLNEQDPARSVSILGLGAQLLVSGSRDERIAQIASRQRGLVSRPQLLMAGLSSSIINGLQARGQLLRVHRGVYAAGHRAPCPLAAETAALLAVGPGATLSHLSAAILWGLLPADLATDRVDVTFAGSERRNRSGIRVHRTRRLDAVDRRIHQGLPVVSPARALVEISPVVSGRWLERALDQGEVHRLLRRSEVSTALDRFPVHSGRLAVKRLLEAQTGTTLTRSDAEELFLDLVRRADLPKPETNARLHGFEVDFLWREANLVVEIDGYQSHGTRRAFESDRRKDAKLIAAGVTVIRFTWNELVNHTYVVIARLARTLARASAA
jgi:very-short-patch-repair endonuclease